MTAPGLIIELTPADVEQYRVFRVAEMEADATGRPMLEEMLAAVEHERNRLGSSMQVAHQVYATPYDPQTMRRYVVLIYAEGLLRRVGEHKGAVVPILFPEMAPKRARRA